MRILAATTLSLSLIFSTLNCSVFPAVQATPTTVEELKAEKVKSLSKRDPKAEDLLSKAQAYLDKNKDADPLLALRMQKALDHISFFSAGQSDKRIKEDMELLEAIAKEHKPPTAEELAPLQERYKKVCASFDDMAFHKDLDRAFHIHDKFVKFTSLGLWDKDKIGSELERMEGLIERAPDIAYGRAQLLDTCKNKRLAHVNKLVYMGSSPHEEIYLSSDRHIVAVLDEGCGKPANMELAEHFVQSPDGKFANMNDCNVPALALPFSPPLTLWAKSRMLEGRVPAIHLKLVDESVKRSNPAYKKATGEFIGIQDILNGELDDYAKKNFALLGPEKTPVLLGLFADIDREAAATAFGEDGRTPFYYILDSKLKDMPESKREEEVKKRFEKGVFAQAKASSAELSNKYGDPNIPDGPERVRDAWKRLAKPITENPETSISLFSSVGAFFANKNAGKLGVAEAGNEAWNKLEYYWPGEKLISWIGINAVGDDAQNDPKGANLIESISPFMAEVRSSSWQATPVMLVDAAPSRTRDPMHEIHWISLVFTKLIPATFPNILAVFVSVPENLTLWSPEGKSAFRTYVSSNKFFNYPLRFKGLTEEKAPEMPKPEMPPGAEASNSESAPEATESAKP